MESTNDQVAALVKQGWRIVSDGPSGVQLEGPKKMKGLDQGAAILGGVLLIVAWPIGLLLIACALLDYWLLTKPETRFIART